MSSPAPLLYNPREESPEILEEMLVGRDDILKEILDDLSRQTASATRQHWLIRGPRGIGKTHLVAILYHRIRGTPELSARLLPVWLGEAAAYDAYSAGMLLLAIANGLVEELEKNGDPKALALRNAIDQKTYKGDDPALFNDLCALLKEESARRGRVLVVFMENLDAWLDNASGQRGTVEAGKLRSLLSDDKEFLFISTTPTRYLPKLSSPGSPLFGHLRERRLRPLSEDELRELFLRLKKITGRAVDVEDDPADPDTRLRWRVLHRLAGGNPRAAAMAFRVISHSTGIRGMVEELGNLLDLQTAYYEARLAKLAPRERAIVRVLALSPTTLTVSEIVVRSRLPERSLSTQMKRLLDEGHVAPAGDERGKGSVFELTDGLFRAWYHYRCGGRELEPLVRFLAMWHEERELELSFASLRRELDLANSAIERNWVKSTAIQIRSALEYARSPIGSSEREHLWAECAREIAEAEVRRTPETFCLGESFDAAAQEGVAGEMFLRGLTLLACGRKDEADAVFLDVAAGLREMTKDAVPERAARALLNRGAALQLSGRADEAQAVFRDVIARFQDGAEPELARQVSLATGNLAVSLLHAGRYEEAIAFFHVSLGSFRNGMEPSDKERVATTMVDLGRALERAGRREEAMTAWRDVLGRFHNNPESPLAYSFAWASWELGIVLLKMGRRGDAIVTFRDLITRLVDSPEPSVREPVARALVNLGMVLEEDGQEEHAIAAYQTLVSRFGGRGKDELRHVALGRCMLGPLLMRAGQPEQAIAVWRDVIDRFADVRESPFVDFVADASWNLAGALSRMGQRDEAMATYRDLINRLGDRTEPLVRARVGSAMFNLGGTLLEAERPEEAIAAYSDIIDRFGDRSEPGAQESVARAMANLAVAFGQTGRPDKMIETCRQLISKFAGSTEPGLKEQIARAMHNLGMALQKAGQHAEAVATYRDLIQRFGESGESTLIGGAMANLGILLGLAGQRDQAIAMYRDHIGRFGDSTDPRMSEQVARVMLNLGQALGGAERYEEAVAALREVMARWGGTVEPPMQAIVGAARLLLAVALAELSRHAEAAEVAARLVDDANSTGNASLGMIARMILAARLYALGRLTEGRLVQADAVRRLAEVSSIPNGLYAEDPAATDPTLRNTLIRLPLTEAKELFDEIKPKANPAMQKSIQFGRFVLDVLMAGEPATGKVKLGPAARTKRALARVPPELRQTVAESAEVIGREREKLQARLLEAGVDIRN